MTNPDGIYSKISFIKRGQWHDAFESHTLVGVDLSKDAEARAVAEKEAAHFEEKY